MEFVSVEMETNNWGEGKTYYTRRTGSYRFTEFGFDDSWSDDIYANVQLR